MPGFCPIRRRWPVPNWCRPIVGNDTLTIDGVYTGSRIEADNTAVNPAADLGAGFSTSGNVWMELRAAADGGREYRRH